jgi:hypothetical protein
MYFRIGTLIGLVCIPIVCIITMRDGGLSLILPSSGISSPLAIILGFFSSFFVGHLLDKRRKRDGTELKVLSAAIRAPLVIFLSGVTIGGLVNFLTHASFSNPSFSLYEDFYRFMAVPLFVLVMFGAPISVLVGLSYFYIFRRLKSKK